MMNRLSRPSRLEFLLLFGVPVLFYVFVVFLPILVGGFLSLAQWSGGPKIRFVGLRNYVLLVRDAGFWNAFLNNLKIIAWCLVGQVGLGLIAALLLSSRFLRARALYRFTMFIPVVLAGVVVGFLWVMVFNSTFGLLNWFLRFIGRPDWILRWLDDPKIVVSSISVTLIWQYMGLNLVIFLASLQNIPQDLLDSASIDGANSFQTALHITLPLLASTITVAISFCIAGNMKIFDHIWIMTGGGPGTASSVMAIFAFKMSFENMIFGYGSAISIGTILLSSILLVLANIAMNFGKRYATQ
jgi:raffinose/stachyose/melibiose transport system permease protein